MPGGSPRVDIPYDGGYVLHAVSGKIKFCNMSANLRPNSVCDPSQFVSELTFYDNNTYRGVLVFSMVTLDFAPVRLEVDRISPR